jgi:hypothetical protein
MQAQECVRVRFWVPGSESRRECMERPELVCASVCVCARVSMYPVLATPVLD